REFTIGPIRAKRHRLIAGPGRPSFLLCVDSRNWRAEDVPIWSTSHFVNHQGVRQPVGNAALTRKAVHGLERRHGQRAVSLLNGCVVHVVVAGGSENRRLDPTATTIRGKTYQTAERWRRGTLKEVFALENDWLIFLMEVGNVEVKLLV